MLCVQKCSSLFFLCFFWTACFFPIPKLELKSRKGKATTHGRKSLSPNPLAQQSSLRCKGPLWPWRPRRRLMKFKIFSTTGNHSWVPMLLKNLLWFLSHSSPSSWHWRMLEPRALGFRISLFQAHRPVVLQVCLCLVALLARLTMLWHGW